MKTTIYLVRHGDVHNPDKILYERMSGFPLSDLGREQAHKLGKFLAGKKISAIYASPLERTRQTAQIVASYHHSLTIVHDERLLEVSTAARGKKMADLVTERWNFYHKKYTQFGGEQLSDIWRRMRHFLKETVKKHKGTEIVVVSHGDPIMITMVKHKGKRLSLGAIRGEEYVQTACGFMLEFDECSPIAVSTLYF